MKSIEKFQPSRRNKRPLTLLEVLIAFLIVMLCFVPLISPHIAMINQQKKFIERTKLDHFVNLLYGHLVQELYENRVQWGAIMEKKVFPIDKELIKKLDPKNVLPYTGTYQFKIGKTKPKIKSDEINPVPPQYFMHLLDLKISFTHLYDNDTKKKSIDFEYQIAVVQRVSESTALNPTEGQ